LGETRKQGDGVNGAAGTRGVLTLWTQREKSLVCNVEKMELGLRSKLPLSLSINFLLLMHELAKTYSMSASRSSTK
jgi:hypothetical protein